MADDGTNGAELWRTNGTSTALFANIDNDESDGPSSYPSFFTALGDWLYFQASDGINGAELWRTNGTTITELVEDINVSTITGSDPSGFTALGDWLYFGATDSTTGRELWRTNGTTTERVADINSGSLDSYPSDFEVLGDWLYFSASDAASGTELWRTNGTSTTRVADINTTGTDGSYPYGLTVLGSYIYFNATSETISKLWRVSVGGTVEPSSPAGTDVFFGCMCDRPILTLDGRLFAQMYTVESGFEFIYLDEPTYGLPLTNRDGSVWSTALVILAAVTAAVGAGLRVRTRAVKRA
jgi:ELWxxDGT repeat protein